MENKMQQSRIPLAFATSSMENRWDKGSVYGSIQLVNERWMKLRISNGSMGLGTEHWSMAISINKERDPDITCLLKEHTTTHEVTLLTLE